MNDLKYASGVASLFATHTRQETTKPVYEGQPCLYCGGLQGDLIFLGYDELLGECWGHRKCKERAGEKYQ